MFLRGLFRKKKTVFSRKDKSAWEAAKSALSAAGISDFRASKYTEEAPGCG